MWSTIKPFGKFALLIEWPQEINTSILAEISSVRTSLESARVDGIVDIVPAYASLTVYYQPEVISYTKLEKIICFWQVKIPEFAHQPGNLWEIPVIYSSEKDKDMAFFISHSGLSLDEIKFRHSSVVYDIFFIGFLPGFLYLGGLDESLYIPRKAVPDLKIPAGSVAIGGKQTGIYPRESPGGWYVIGHTDFKVIDLFKPPYCEVKAGDQVKFYPK